VGFVVLKLPQYFLQPRLPFPAGILRMGMTICHTDEFVQSHFLDGNLIVRYINKMATNGGGGVVVVCALQRLQAILVPG
jgi:hypothetical protein